MVAESRLNARNPPEPSYHARPALPFDGAGFDRPDRQRRPRFGPMVPDRSGSRSGRSCPSPGAGNPPAGEPADVYDVPVMGFGRIPARYNARGIEVDRSNPFALHAETTLTVPAGPHRLILRSRNAARLVVDGEVLAETKRSSPTASGHEDVPEVVAPEDPRWRYAAPGEPGADRRLDLRRSAAPGRALGARRRQEAPARDRRAVGQRRRSGRGARR